MYAIVNLNGKQYEVQEGRYIDVDRLAQQPDEAVEIGNVLMVVDGENSLVGAPFVDGATVRAKVLNHFRGPKVLVYKMRCKKGYRRKNGHRQEMTRLQIEDLVFPGKKASAKPAKQEKPAKAEPVAAEATVEAPAETQESKAKTAKKASEAKAGAKKSEAKSEAPSGKKPAAKKPAKKKTEKEE